MSLVYSDDKVAIVRAAKARGMSDGQILEVLTRGEFGDPPRRKIVREWAAALGLTEVEATAVAVRRGVLRP